MHASNEAPPAMSNYALMLVLLHQMGASAGPCMLLS